MKTLFGVLFLVLCLLVPATAQAKTTKIVKKTTVIHRHVHEYAPAQVVTVAPVVTEVQVTAGPVAVGVVRTRSLSHRERRDLRKGRLVIVSP